MTPHKMDMVQEFMQVMQQDRPEKPCIDSLSIETRYLRKKLIDEEANELYVATSNVEALDAIADLLYVVLGAAIACGFSKEQVDKAFDEVHRSNMTKLWTYTEVHGESGDFGGIENGCMACRGGRNTTDKNRTFLVKNQYGKVLKSPSYSPANLEPILK